MNRKILLIIMLAFLASVSATAKLLGKNTLSVTPYTYGGSEAENIAFDNVSASTTFSVPPQYIRVNYDADDLWCIKIYTDNFDAATNPTISTTTWGYNYGGMKGTNEGARCPLCWHASTSSVLAKPFEVGSATDPSSGWNFVKDKSDQDDPNTDNIDESWFGPKGDAAYANIAFGGPNYQNVVDPRVGEENGYSIPDDDKEFALEIEGCFGSAPADTYSTTISFDLYHLALGPDISHKPIKKIGIIGNKIVFKATISNPTSTMLHYIIEGSSGSVKGVLVGTNGTYTYTLSRDKVTKPGKVYYRIEAKKGERRVWWPGEFKWQEIDVSQTTTSTIDSKGGKVILPDGNPDDGEVMVDIPEGALSKDTKITIEQITDLSIIPGYGEAGDWKPVAIYNFTEEGIRFKKPVTMNLLYFDLDNNGKPEDWKGKEIDFNESQLACYWWDGIAWRPVGGRVDKDRNIVSVKVSHFSYYGLFKARPMEISQYRPKERIITPAYADGKNDVAYFSGLSGQATTIKIYDITGKKIRTIDGEPYEWDGKDENGNIVESGVYIYQFKADVNGKKRLVSGTIAVAK